MTEVVGVEFETPQGETLRFEWDERAIGKLGAESDGTRPWRLVGEIDWDEIEALRVISARFDDGGTLAVAAIRPVGAAGHGDEIATGVLSSEEGPESIEETLISTEYAGQSGDGAAPRRVGLELHLEEVRAPVRVAGDVTEVSETSEGGVRHLKATLELRRDGAAGHGIYEILTAA